MADTEGPIDAQAVADMPDLNIQEVRRYARTGSPPAYRLPGTKKYLVFRSEVLEAVRSHPVTPDDSPLPRLRSMSASRVVFRTD